MGRNAVKSGRIVKTTRVRTFKTTKKRLRKVLKAAGSDRDASRRQKSSGRYNSSKRPFPDTVSRGGESPGMEEWAGLGVPLPLLRGLSDLGFHQPTEIQRAVLPIATQQESCDIVAAAETGSGKTLAFSIPILRYILSSCHGTGTEEKERPSPRQQSRAWEVCVTDKHGRQIVELNQVFHGEGGEGGEGVTGEAGEGGEGVTGEGGEDSSDSVTGEGGEDSGDGVTGEGGDDGDSVSLEVDDSVTGRDESHDQSRDSGRGFVDGRDDIPDEEFYRMLQGEIPPWGSDDIIADPPAPHDTTTGSHDTIAGSHEPQKLLALIMTPTRELALQIKAHISAVLKHTRIKVCAVVGGMATEKQERLLRQRPPVVIATPGRLWKLMSEGEPHLCCLDDLRYLVLDEADRMVEFGHYQELGRILDRVKGAGLKKKGAESVPQRCNFVFSATLTLPRRSTERKRKRKSVSGNETLKNLMSRIQLREDAHIIDLTRSKVTVGGLIETKIMCTPQEKDVYLYHFLLMHPGRTLVFINSIDSLQRVKSMLELLRLLPRPLHAQMQQRQRIKNLERFTADPAGLLLATDVAARGLDIPQVQHVIHYQVPKNSELYVHRSGRTARGRSSEGLSLLLVAPEDLKAYRNICQTLNREQELENFPVDPAYHQAVRERVLLANQIQALEHRQRRGQRAADWMKQSAEAMDVELDDELLSGAPKLTNKESKKLHLLKAELQAALRRTVMPKGMSLSFPSQRDRELLSAIRRSQDQCTGGIALQKDALSVAKRKRY